MRSLTIPWHPFFCNRFNLLFRTLGLLTKRAAETVQTVRREVQGIIDNHAAQTGLLLFLDGPPLAGFLHLSGQNPDLIVSGDRRKSDEMVQAVLGQMLRICST